MKLGRQKYGPCIHPHDDKDKRHAYQTQNFVAKTLICERP